MRNARPARAASRHPFLATADSARPGIRPPAFTLIEVLVVVAIIALLVAIFLPSLAGARASAKAMLCLNNLNQFGKASNMYAHDHKGYVPRDYYYSQFDTRNDSSHGLPHVLVPEVLSGYLGGPKYPLIPAYRDPRTADRDKILAPIFARMAVLQCPVFPRGGTPARDNTGRPIPEQVYDYVVNSFNFEQERQFKQGSNQYFNSVGVTMLSRIPNAGRLIYMTEAHWDMPFDDFGWHDFFQPAHLWWGADSRMSDDYRHAAPGFRHPGRGVATSVSFDGHGEKLTFRQMTINRFTPNYTSREVPIPAAAGG